MRCRVLRSLRVLLSRVPSVGSRSTLLQDNKRLSRMVMHYSSRVVVNVREDMAKSYRTNSEAAQFSLATRQNWIRFTLTLHQHHFQQRFIIASLLSLHIHRAIYTTQQSSTLSAHPSPDRSTAYHTNALKYGRQQAPRRADCPRHLRTPRTHSSLRPNESRLHPSAHLQVLELTHHPFPRHPEEALPPPRWRANQVEDARPIHDTVEPHCSRVSPRESKVQSQYRPGVPGAHHPSGRSVPHSPTRPQLQPTGSTDDYGDTQLSTQ